MADKVMHASFGIGDSVGKTFFSPSFGMLVDRFGVSWMVIVPPPQ